MAKTKKKLTVKTTRRIKRLVVFTAVTAIAVVGMNIGIKIYNNNRRNVSEVKTMSQTLPTDKSTDIEIDTEGNIVLAPASSEEISFVKASIISKLNKDAKNKLGLTNSKIEAVYGYYKIECQDTSWQMKTSQMSILVKDNGELKCFVYDDTNCDLQIEGDSSIDVLSSMYAKISDCSPVDVQSTSEMQDAIMLSNKSFLFVSPAYDYLEKNGKNSTAVDIYSLNDNNMIEKTQYRVDEMQLANNEISIYQALAMDFDNASTISVLKTQEQLSENQKSIQQIFIPNPETIVSETTLEQ